MVELHRSSDTWFYPILGKGFHGSAYGHFPDVSAGFHLSGIVPSFVHLTYRYDVLIVGVLALIAPLVLEGPKLHDYRSLFLLFTGTWAAAVFIYMQSGGTDRYSYPFVMATVLFVFVECLPTITDASQWPQPRWLILVGLFAFLLGKNFQDGSAEFKAVLTRRYPSEAYLNLYQRAQVVVPQGAVILACLAKPFLLDFRRNTVYTVDHAGGASPPPGMPVLGSDAELASYLRLQSVRYVIYSYADEASYGRAKVGNRLQLGGNFNDDSLRVRAEYNIAFRDHLVALSQQGTKVFDDGRVFVLDLDARNSKVDRRSSPSSSEHPAAAASRNSSAQ
jgi:hypothetical protein